MPNDLAPDVELILNVTNDLWEELRGCRIFITGGTGFFGSWLLESFVAANNRFQLGASATVLTRDPAGFRLKAPHLALNTAVKFLPGDVRTFQFPSGSFDLAIHAATEASAALAIASPLEMHSTIVDGTRRVLDFCRISGVRKLLLTSSGAVYGRQPGTLSHIPEDYAGAPDPLDPRSVYGQGKRTAEHLCSIYSCAYGIEAKIARCFAFVGPGLPLDTHFAIGNFIRDALAGGPVEIRSDGTTFRSYLYAADLAIWLWTILFRGQSCRPYNVGSQEDLTISAVAEEVAAAISPRSAIHIAGNPIPGAVAERYVPSTRRAQHELGLAQYTPLSEAIRRTAQWARLNRMGCRD